MNDWTRTHIRKSMAPPATALDVLRKANNRDEVGYAHGCSNVDWPAVQECLDRGWIIELRDASIGGRGDIEGRPFQRRTIYGLTAAGKQERDTSQVSCPEAKP